MAVMKKPSDIININFFATVITIAVLVKLKSGGLVAFVGIRIRLVDLRLQVSSASLTVRVAL